MFAHYLIKRGLGTKHRLLSKPGANPGLLDPQRSLHKGLTHNGSEAWEVKDYQHEVACGCTRRADVCFQRGTLGDGQDSPQKLASQTGSHLQNYEKSTWMSR
jgi:hypothetical protein